MLRVAQVMGKMNGGGVEAVVMNYYRHVDRSRVQFDFVVDSDSQMVPNDEVESMGGRVFLVPPLGRLAAHQRVLRRLFRQEGWQIVHSHRNALSVFPLRAAKAAGVPVRIAHSHSTWGRGELKRNAVKAILRTQANRYPTHRMACTRHAGEWLFGRDAEFKVLYNAIELERFAFDAHVRLCLREQLGIPSDAFVVGNVGRLTFQKNQAFLVDEFARMKGAGDSRLLLVGEGPDMEMLAEKSRALGVADRVHMLGRRQDVDRLYSAMDAFCLPSNYEGLGIVAIEAQVSGVPTLVSTEVPEEAVLSNVVRVLPLSDGVWSNELDRLRASRDAASSRHVDLSPFRSYQIALEAPSLVSYYESAIEETL